MGNIIITHCPNKILNILIEKALLPCDLLSHARGGTGRYTSKHLSEHLFIHKPSSPVSTPLIRQSISNYLYTPVSTPKYGRV